MSRHRNVRHRVYSFDEDDYEEDEEHGDHGSGSPTSEQFIYKRDCPSRNVSLFSFIDSLTEDTTIDDADLLRIVAEVQSVIGDIFNREQILSALRANNYDPEKAIEALHKSSTQTESKAKQYQSTASISITSPSSEGVSIQSNVDINQDAGAAKKASTVIALGAPMPQEYVTRSAGKSAQEVEDKSSSVATLAYQGKCVVDQRLETDMERLHFERAAVKTRENALKSVAKDSKQQISMIVIGHVDAGKSTLMGHLLFKLGRVSKSVMHKYERESKGMGKSSFAYAWVMDADVEERERGVTMDVGKSFFETENKLVTLLDAPGHRDFVPEMIAGASQADVAILVVPAAAHEFEAAFENSGQTKEHILLVRSFGVTQMIIAVNKMDSVQWSEDRFKTICDSLQQYLLVCGFRLQLLWFVPVSGLLGCNLRDRVPSDACPWYDGPTLFEAIDNFSPPPRPISKPFRMSISDVYKSVSLGSTACGRIYSGALAAGDKILVMPLGQRATIKSIERSSESVTTAIAGENVDIGITGLDIAQIRPGNILCSVTSPVKLSCRFDAQVMTMPSMQAPIVKGVYFTMHIHSIDEPINVTKLHSIVDRTGNFLKKRPRCIPRNVSALIEVTSPRPLCLELFSDFKPLGRFTLRDRGVTIAAGIITELF